MFLNPWTMEANKTNPKPTTGRLMYNGKQIGEIDTFRNLAWKKVQFIKQGYDKSLFKLKY